MNKTFWRFRIKNNMSISTGKLDYKGPKMNFYPETQSLLLQNFAFVAFVADGDNEPYW